MPEEFEDQEIEELIEMLCDDMTLMGPDDVFRVIRRDDIEQLTVMPPDDPPALTFAALEAARDEVFPLPPGKGDQSGGLDAAWDRLLLHLHAVEIDLQVFRSMIPHDETDTRREMIKVEASMTALHRVIVTGLVNIGRDLGYDDEKIIEAVGEARRSGFADHKAVIALAIKESE